MKYDIIDLLFPVQIILAIICWTYMIKYVINLLKEKKNERNN